MSQQPNIIVFGETGAGKSSVINMILGHDKAKVSNGLLGETFQSAVYPIELDGKTYNLYDTVGLGEHSRGTVDSAKAVKNLYRLVTDLSSSGGVNLLVFVIKCGQRLTETMHKNYTLFHHGFCDSKVPIMIVVTACENEEPTMDTWWRKNAKPFTHAGMSFNSHACVCAFKGGKTKDGGYRNEDLVEESTRIVKQLIVRDCMENGWEKPSIDWFRQVVGSLADLFRTSKVPTIYTKLFHRLTKAFTTSEAESIIEAISQTENSQSIPNIIVFGETGVGKSSVINMILGSDNTRSSLQQPVKSAVYPVKIRGDTYNLHDTVGLGVHNGNVDAAKAIRKLYRLLDDLSNAGGINLLVYVVRCDKRPPETMSKTYNLIHHGFCDSMVPIVLVVTGCENVGPTMGGWWTNNEASFIAAGMSFKEQACVCTTRGTKTRDGSSYRFQDLVEESELVVTELIVQYCDTIGWKKKPINSPQPNVVNFLRFRKIPTVYRNLYNRLKQYFPRAEAANIIEAISVTGE